MLGSKEMKVQLAKMSKILKNKRGIARSTKLPKIVYQRLLAIK